MKYILDISLLNVWFYAIKTLFSFSITSTTKLTFNSSLVFFQVLTEF
jgi:hypothetical protein